jgi:hypothetical protein
VVGLQVNRITGYYYKPNYGEMVTVGLGAASILVCLQICQAQLFSSAASIFDLSQKLGYIAVW